MAFFSRAKRNPNDDVSRLLDPSYSSQSRYSPIVKDSRGDFHDPDYRPFTPIAPRSVSPRRRSSPRPYWETLSMTDNHDDDDDDDDASDERDMSEGYAYSSRYAHRRSGQYRRDLRYPYLNSYAHSYTSSYPTSSYPTYSYTPSTLAEYSPPTSYDSEATVLNEEPFEEKEKQGWTGRLMRRRNHKVKEVEEETWEEPDNEFTSPEPLSKKEEYVPTCGEVFQRHWQTIRLSVNLSIFRAQRRMKHRVHSLMSAR